jgi:hypothetical protein
VLIAVFSVVCVGRAVAFDQSGPPACLSNASVTLTATPSTVTLGQSTTLVWSVSNCPYISGVDISPGPGLVGLTGTAVYKPGTTGYLNVTLFQSGNSLVKTSTLVTVLPPASTHGRTTISIDANDQQDLFAQAIATPNTTVVLADNVNLNLGGRSRLPIGRGVQILGGRSSTKLGPRVFTNSHPDQLFRIHADNSADGIKIYGLRIDGGMSGQVNSDDPTETGIAIYSSVNVEVGNCEIYGWSGTAVTVQDRDQIPGRISLRNPSAVWVHDNYIHHNRHWGEQGYGVQSGHGAYAIIERNVFDYNRHAIEAGGDPGTGYLAYDNLVLRGGGENTNVPFTETTLQHTHQFDVHGTQDDGWGRGYYAGPAGEYFEYRGNTLYYDIGPPLKVRGYPSIGAQVVRNVFAHVEDGAINQTDGNNLSQSDNRFNMSLDPNPPTVGDFDGDGIIDQFLSTGVTWWYRSGATAQRHYLNKSERTTPELDFLDYNGDGRTDIRLKAVNAVDRLIYSGGGTKILRTLTRAQGIEAAPQVNDVYWQVPGATTVYGFQILGQSSFAAVPVADVQTINRTLLGQGDFNGDGSPDLLLRNAGGQVYVELLDANTVVVPTWAGGRRRGAPCPAPPSRGSLTSTRTAAQTSCGVMAMDSWSCGMAASKATAPSSATTTAGTWPIR